MRLIFNLKIDISVDLCCTDNTDKWENLTLFKKENNDTFNIVTQLKVLRVPLWIKYATLLRGVFRGAMGTKPPPWTSEIYLFQGVYRLQRVRSPPGKI